jgi:glycerophosphoryl diester phosphodiesterase
VTRPLVVAHRGDHRHAPENSLAAVSAALEAGVDGIELDVRASADGVAIVVHDASLARVQRIDARVNDLTADELAEHGVPRLTEVLELVPPEVLLDVELKEATVGAVRDAVRSVRGAHPQGLIFSSFDEVTLAELVAAEPGWPRWLIDRWPGGVGRASALGCSGVALDWQVIDGSTVDTARRAGLHLMAWTVRDRATFERLAVLDVDAICAEGEALAQRLGSASGGSSH